MSELAFDLRPVRFRRQLFLRVVHYTIWVCDDPSVLDPHKLARVLWYVDRMTFVALGEPLTGATYIKHRAAPMPKALAAGLEALARAGLIAVRPATAKSEAPRFFALSEPDLGGMPGESISRLEQAIRHVCFGGAAKARDFQAHDRMASIARLGEAIPYVSALAGVEGDVTTAELSWAAAVLEDRQSASDAQLPAQLQAIDRAACAGLLWHLERDPDAGLAIPTASESVFIHKQAPAPGSRARAVIAVYRFDLDELDVLAWRFGDMTDPTDA